ncbi:MAG: hypothetical protein JSR77_18050 [Planctomycetes bacterium]|nr:hypothetical protein [Planctomycetota bacterium]
MNISRIRRQSFACIAAALMSHAAQAQLSTQFTYQGELQTDNALATGQYQMRFAAYDAAIGGAQVGSALVAVVDVVNGKFTVVLDFGTSLSNTNAHLEIGVRPNGSLNAYTNLAPRQRLTATPNAVFASSAATAGTANFATNAGNANFASSAGSASSAQTAQTANFASSAGSANSAASASNASNANNANLLGGQSPAYYVNANNLSAGTIPDGRLAATVARTNATQTFIGANTFSNAANAFAGVGTGLTALDASNITTGLLANARTTGVATATGNTLVLRDASGGFSGNTITAALFNGNGSGLTNLDAADLATGIIPAARFPAWLARTDAPNNFGAFTNNFGGFVGIGTTLPAAPLTVAGPGATLGMFGSPAVGSTQLVLGVSASANGYSTIQGIRASGSLYGDVVMNLAGGRVGIAEATPDARLHVLGDTNVTTIIDSNATTGTWLAINNRSDINGGRFWNLISTGTANGVGTGNLLFAVGNALGIADAIPMIITRQGRVGIGTTTPGTELHVVGTTRTNVLEIMGGSDIAEPYCVAPSGGVAPAPGMVVSIDPDHAGKLRVSSSAYDTTVAGIVSGANGVNVGLTLRQEGSTVADGSLPIANVGRVWCWADADTGAIQPGDLLTTSNTPGHAMKAAPSKANGAILGKAMSRLESGKGMVLVLVGLQ